MNTLIGCGLSPQVRRANERELVAHLHSKLVENGVTKYSLDYIMKTYFENITIPLAFLLIGYNTMSASCSDQSERDFLLDIVQGLCEDVLKYEGKL